MTATEPIINPDGRGQYLVTCSCTLGLGASKTRDAALAVWRDHAMFGECYRTPSLMLSERAACAIADFMFVDAQLRGEITPGDATVPPTARWSES